MAMTVVTGAAGAIGSACVRLLLRGGGSVVGVDARPFPSDLKEEPSFTGITLSSQVSAELLPSQSSFLDLVCKFKLYTHRLNRLTSHHPHHHHTSHLRLHHAPKVDRSGTLAFWCIQDDLAHDSLMKDLLGTAVHCSFRFSLSRDV